MDPIQNPSQQPIQNPTPVFTPQPKPNYLKVILSSIFVTVLLTSIIYLYLQNQKLQKQIINSQIIPTKKVPSPIPKITSSIVTNKTSGWNIYSSDNLGISFEYPPEYKDPEENTNYISLISPLNPEPKKGYELQNGELKVEIYVSNASPNETLVELVKKKKPEKILSEEKIIVNGVEAIKQTWEGGAGNGQTILLINNNKEFGIIKYPAVTTRDNEFDQILSTFKFVDKMQESNLPIGWTYYKYSACNINIPIPPEKLDINKRTWKTEIQSTYDLLGFFKGNAVSTIHRNPEEASGFISGMVTVACGQTNDSLIKLNSDFHSYLTLQNTQNTNSDVLIELTSNSDITMWQKPSKEMTFVGGMFDPKQKYYLLVNSNKWYLITKKSDSSNSEINEQTDQIFSLLKFVE